MATLKDNSILDKDNWSDGLLIKDQSGKLHLFKEKSSQLGSNFASNISEDEVQKDSVGLPANINTAPLDDSFAPIQNIIAKAGDKSELVFHPDDKQQLDEVAKTVPKDTSKKYSINKIVNKIIEKQGLIFDDANRQKFTDILYDFFRDRKSAVVVRELLYIKVLVDNKPLDQETVDNILSIVKGIKNKMFAVGGLVVRQDVLEENFVGETAERIEIKDLPDSQGSAQDEVRAVLSEIKDSFAPVPTQDENKQVAATEEKKDAPSGDAEKPKPEIKQPEPAPKKDVPSGDAGDKQPKPEKKEDEAVLSQLPKVSRPSAIGSVDKKQVIDVVSKPKPAPEPIPQAPPVHHELTGPVQELEVLTLDNFRRFGDSVQERVDKVAAKIAVLEKDSFTKKAQGIEAWRRSQVYKIYLELGQESMIQGKEIATLVEEYKEQGKPSLAVDEFFAISDLNKKLRF